MMRTLTRSLRVFAFLGASSLATSPVLAANKDIERLAMQIATLQGQLTELQRSGEETRAELRRLSELVAEQNALLRKAAADKRQQDEAMSVGLRELGERVSELAETLESIKMQTAASLPPATDPSGATTIAAAPGVPPGTTPATGTPAPATPTAPVQAPRELYSQAYADFARGNYDLAMQGFTEYLRAYPGTDFADNAQYWIGECRYARNDVKGALSAFRETMERYPKGNKMPDAMLKSGQCLESMGDIEGARTTYREVARRFSGTAAAAAADERRAKLP
jgi:tol-pal system protein YbgF